MRTVTTFGITGTIAATGIAGGTAITIVRGIGNRADA